MNRIIPGLILLAASALGAPPAATYTISAVEQKPFHFGEAVSVSIQGDVEANWRDESRWTVHFNGVPMEVRRVSPGESPGTYELFVRRTGLDGAAMDRLAPDRFGVNRVRVRLEHDEVLLRPAVGDKDFLWVRLMQPPRLWFFCVVAAIVLIGMIYVYFSTGVLRDENTALKETERPFSLAKVQFGMWTLVIMAGYLFLYLQTGSFNGILNPTAWTLLGISVATSALAATWGNETVPNKDENDAADVEPVAPPPPMKHVSFFTDILSDSKGWSIHRLQMLMWTVVFVAVFGFEVYEEVAFPDFDAQVFGLMGISSAAYLFFRRKEK